MTFRSYSVDLKILAVTLMQQGLTRREVRRHLRSAVSVRTLTRWVMLYERTLAVIRDPDEYQKRGRRPCFSDEDLQFMLELIERDPTLYLDEVQVEMYHTTDQLVALSTIASDLKTRLMLSLKKVRTVHPNQCPIKRAQYLDQVAGLPSDMLVFLGKYGISSCYCRVWVTDQLWLMGIDETAVVERDLFRLNGRSKKGTRTRRVERTRAGKRYTLLPAVDVYGVLAVSTQEGSVLRSDFEHFLKNRLVGLLHLLLADFAISVSLTGDLWVIAPGNESLSWFQLRVGNG